MYAPYSNFSFYTTKDVLRMIDFNLSPSFVLTQDPSYQLTLTNSARYYSTEYIQYKSLIKEIYDQVNDVLKEVASAEWIDRTVVENGVILNTYDNGKHVLINYTDHAVTFDGTLVPALSARTLD